MGLLGKILDPGGHFHDDSASWSLSAKLWGNEHPGGEVPGNPGSQAAALAQADWGKFMEDYKPLIEKQMASLNGTELVDQAEKDAAMAPGLLTNAVNRAASRRGGLTATQQSSLATSRALDAATGTADTLNNARVDQRTRNTDSALKMSRLGTDIYQMGLDNMRESEGLSAQRRMNNASAAAASKANNTNMAVTAAMTIAMIA